jgi:hypothetical protein
MPDYAELERLKKDAARYRFIRDNDPDSEGPYITRHIQNSWGKWGNTVERGTAADDLIDTLMSEKS